MAVSESSSYMAYLRDVARNANASIAPFISAGTHVRHQHSAHQDKRTITRESKSHERDDHCLYKAESAEYVYAYDYLRDPPACVLHNRNGSHTGHMGPTRYSNVRAQPALTTASSPSTSQTRAVENSEARAGATVTKIMKEAKDPLNATFDQMYATLREIGSQEIRAAAASRKKTHRLYPLSPCCSPHSPLSSPTRKHVHATSCTGTRRMTSKQTPYLTCSALALEPTSSSACFQHSWNGSSLTIRVPPMPAEDRRNNTPRQKLTAATTESDTAVLTAGKALASTETSAITSSPTKLTSSASSSSTSSSDTLSYLAAGTHTRTFNQQQQQQHRKRTYSRVAAGFACPYCCRRHNSCQCAGRLCQHNSSREARRCGNAATVDKLVPTAPLRRSASPCTVHVTISPTVVRPNPISSPLSPRANSVRLKWPNQPEVHESRLPPNSPREASPLIHQRHSSSKRKQSLQRHSAHTTKHVNKSKSDAKAMKESVLRDVAERTCTCYWSDFPDLKMAINPSSHAAVCPYQVHNALYDELMNSFEDDQQGGSGDDVDVEALSSVASSSSSTSFYSVECSGRQHATQKKNHGKKGAEANKAVHITGAAVRDAVGKALTHREEVQELHEQRRRWLAEEEAASKKRRQGRAAVIGSTQRRTYMEQLMSAARDSPSPTKAVRQAKRTAAERAKVKEQKQNGQHKDCSSPSPTSIVGVTVISASKTAAEPPLPSPLLPEAPPTEQTDLPDESGNASTLTPATHAQGEGEKGGEGKADVESDVLYTAQTDTTGIKQLQINSVDVKVDDAHHREGSTDHHRSSTPIVEEPVEGETESGSTQDPLRALSRPRVRPAVGVPGPGAYHVDAAYAWTSTVQGIRGTAMPKAARMPPIKSITPGPGAYNLCDSGKDKKDEDDAGIKKTPPAADANAEKGAVEDGTGNTGGDTATAVKETASTNTIGKGIVFNSTGARQLQLHFGLPYQRCTTWAKRVAALPGPGAYNIVDGDRIDQSKPLGTARLGFQFAKSVDGAHFTGFTLTSEVATTGGAAVVAAASTDPEGAASTAERGKGKLIALTTATPAALLVPWRDWAGGAYIGAATTSFWAHPSLAGGGRRTLPRRGEKREEAPVLEGVSLPTNGHSSAAAAAAAATMKDTSGGVWRGVGSGVALRLTSQRFPVQSSCPNPPPASNTTRINAGPGSASESKEADGEDDSAEAAMECLRRSRGQPGPASYEIEAALKLIQKRAPEVSMTFKHDRGPRGPLRSTSTVADNTEKSAIAPLPGPGSYDVNINDVWGPRRSPQWSFGTAARMPHTPTSSTAGAAVATRTTTHNNVYTPGEREVDEEHVPGPGAYNTEAASRAVRSSVSCAIIGAAPRFQTEEGFDRGVENTYHSAVEFGADLNKNTFGGNRAGPGTYDVGSVYDLLLGRVKGGALPRAPRCKEDGASYSAFGSRATGPGPGTYILPPLPVSGPTVNLNTTAPRFPSERMQPEKGSLNTTNNDIDFTSLFGLSPGPGAYDVEAAARLANRPGTVIGRAPRVSFLVSSLTNGGSTSAEVGPGTYNLPALPSGRTAVLSHLCGRDPMYLDRLAEKDVPGPGLYDPVDVQAPAPRSFSLAHTSARFGDAITTTATSATGLLATGPAVSDVPGPGAYDVRTDGTSGGGNGAATQNGAGPATFGTAPRFIEDGNSSNGAIFDSAGGCGSLVGPGSYDPYINDASSAPIYSFPRGRRFSSSAGNNGEHDGSDSTGGAGSGIGPGAYEVVDVNIPRRSAVMGSAVARPCISNGNSALYKSGGGVDTSIVPGPGAYDPQYAQVEKNVPQVALARAAAHDAEPGDVSNSNGAYANSDAGSGLGPGQYDPTYPSDIAQHARGYSFGSAPRAAANANIVISSNNVGVSEKEPDQAPGPGAYEIRVTRDGQFLGSGAGGRHSHQFGTAPRHAAAATPNGHSPLLAAAALNDAPGPGAYMPETYTDMCAQYGTTTMTIGTAPRTFLTDEEVRRMDFPGPGAYTPEVFTDIGTRALLSSANAAPRFGTAPRTLIGDEEAKAAFGPGPGAYEPNLYAGMAVGPSVTFPRAADRLTTSNAVAAAATAAGDTPGPGAYAQENSDHLLRTGERAFYFGSAPRFPQQQSAGSSDGGDGGCVVADASPAPNAYSPSDTAVRAVTPAYRFGTAAGHDDGRSTSVSPKEGDGVLASLTSTGKDIMPGPGAYDVDRADRWMRQNTGGAVTAYRFGTAVRFDAEGGDAVVEGEIPGSGVGPGAYDVAAGIARSSQIPTPAAYSFPRAPAHVSAHGRTSDGTFNGIGGGIADSNPGPGAYSLEAGYRATLPRAAAAAFSSIYYDAGSSTSDENRRDGEGAGQTSNNKSGPPGPGAYQLPPAFPEGPQWSFGTAPKQADTINSSFGADAVGPGSYAVPLPPPLHNGVTVPRASTPNPLNENTVPTPGPGAYDVTEAYAKSVFSAAAGGVRIGTAPRYPADVFAEGALCDGPGPGAYAPNINSSSRATCGTGGGGAGPTFPQTSRMPSDRDTNAAVGPGSYDLPSLTLTSTAVSAPRFGTAPRTTDLCFPVDGATVVGTRMQTGQDVGPGSYVIDRADAQVLPRAPAYSIAASSRDGVGRDVLAAAAINQPGPGSYNVPVEVQSHARAALVLGRPTGSTDLAARQRATPGPGSYDVPEYATASGFATAAAVHCFGTAPTHRLPVQTSSKENGIVTEGNENVGPGPGAYDSAAAFSATQTRGPANGFTIAGRPVDWDQERRSAEPGPGTYDVALAFSQGGGATAAPSYSFGSAPRMSTTTAENGVGPGAYDTSANEMQTHNTGPSIRFTQAPRMWNPDHAGLGNAAPGPGAYDARGDQHQSSSPSFTIPRGPRAPLRVGDTEASPMVGPGSYSPQDQFNTAKGKQIGSNSTIGQAPRVWSTNNVDTPGPGSYDVQEAEKRMITTAAVGSSSAPSFGTSQRPDPAAGRSDTPGPGTYDSATAATATAVAGRINLSFGMSERPDVTLNANPGPGTYENVSTALSNGAGVTFGSAARPGPELRHQHATPGPGTYDQAASTGLLAGNKAGPSFGSSLRPSAVLNDNPGPGSYDGGQGDLKNSYSRGDSLATTFPVAGRPSPILNDNPGPGAYQIATSAGTATSFGFGERPSPIINDNPGPGTYHTASALPAGPAPRFGFSERPNLVTNSNPGPGTYHSMYVPPAGPAPSFGYGERPSPIANDNPGPGAYHREAYIAHLTDPPGASFGKAERPSATLNSNPGPGTYYRETPAETYPPTFGLSARPSTVLNANPGPGTYYKSDFFTHRGNEGLSRDVGFGLAERPSPVLNNNPGPGTYYRERGVTCIAEDLTAAGGLGKADRLNPVRTDTPGPGAYYHGDESQNACTPRRGVTIGTSERPDPKLNDNPGPGAYFRGVVPGLVGAATSTSAAPAAGKPRSESVQRRRRKRPTAADTLRKLASVGYPLDLKADAEEVR